MVVLYAFGALSAGGLLSAGARLYAGALIPWWFQLADLVLLPADLLGLPFLVWAILAGRSPRPAAVIS